MLSPVTTKQNNDMHYIWDFQAGGSFTVTRDKNGNPDHGLSQRRPDQSQYLEERRPKDLMKKHSEFISYPIFLWTAKTTEEVASDDEDEDTKKEEEGDVEEVDKEKETKSKKKMVKEGLPTTSRSPSGFRKPEENHQGGIRFYNWLSSTCVWRDSSSSRPSSVSRTSLIQRRIKLNNINLDVRRVFIYMDNCKELIPEYLSFGKGVVDSDDLHLNIYIL